MSPTAKVSRCQDDFVRFCSAEQHTIAFDWQVMTSVSIIQWS